MERCEESLINCGLHYHHPIPNPRWPLCWPLDHAGQICWTLSYQNHHTIKDVGQHLVNRHSLKNIHDCQPTWNPRQHPMEGQKGGQRLLACLDVHKHWGGQISRRMRVLWRRIYCWWWVIYRMRLSCWLGHGHQESTWDGGRIKDCWMLINWLMINDQLINDCSSYELYFQERYRLISHASC